jgi:hypothetical protein
MSSPVRLSTPLRGDMASPPGRSGPRQRPALAPQLVVVVASHLLHRDSTSPVLCTHAHAFWHPSTQPRSHLRRSLIVVRADYLRPCSCLCRPASVALVSPPADTLYSCGRALASTALVSPLADALTSHSLALSAAPSTLGLGKGEKAHRAACCETDMGSHVKKFERPCPRGNFQREIA